MRERGEQWSGESRGERAPGSTLWQPACLLHVATLCKKEQKSRACFSTLARCPVGQERTCMFACVHEIHAAARAGERAGRPTARGGGRTDRAGRLAAVTHARCGRSLMRAHACIALAGDGDGSSSKHRAAVAAWALRVRAPVLGGGGRDNAADQRTSDGRCSSPRCCRRAGAAGGWPQ